MRRKRKRRAVSLCCFLLMSPFCSSGRNSAKKSSRPSSSASARQRSDHWRSQRFFSSFLVGETSFDGFCQVSLSERIRVPSSPKALNWRRQSRKTSVDGNQSAISQSKSRNRHPPIGTLSRIRRRTESDRELADSISCSQTKSTSLNIIYLCSGPAAEIFISAISGADYPAQKLIFLPNLFANHLHVLEESRLDSVR